MYITGFLIIIIIIIISADLRLEPGTAAVFERRLRSYLFVSFCFHAVIFSRFLTWLL